MGVVARDLINLLRKRKRACEAAFSHHLAGSNPNHEETGMAETKPSLSPKALEKMQRHRQAVMMLARLAAKRAVQDELRARGVRVTLVLPAEIIRQAREYLPRILSFISRR